MKRANSLLYGILVAGLAAGAVAPLSATTLIRENLERLTAGNRTIIVGEVLDAVSYWNQDGTFILTDVRVDVIETLKGELADRELTVTLMGGTVGDLTTLIVGGAELIPGRPYVLFLNPEDLPGAPGVTTVRDHCQGAFDISMTKNGLRAISQATAHALVPDIGGDSGAAGGPEGFLFDEMVASIRVFAEQPHGAGQEVEK